MFGEPKTGRELLFKFPISIECYNRFYEICMIENDSPRRMLEKLIMRHVPIVPPQGEFKFIPIRGIYVGKLRKTKPDAFVHSLFGTGPVSPNWNEWHDYKKGIISFDEFKRKYVEKLMGEKAQKRIEELKQMKKTKDVYIACSSVDDEHSIRKVFVDYVEGKLIWK